MNWEEKYDALASMIEGYRHERDEAKARVIDAALIHAELVRERDEARALNAEWAQKAATWIASPEAAQRLDGYRDLGQQVAEAQRERDEARAEVQDYREQLRKLPDANRVASQDAYRRGAEAMREACARVVDAADVDPRPCVRVSEMADALRALPIPEEP